MRTKPLQRKQAGPGRRLGFDSQNRLALGELTRARALAVDHGLAHPATGDGVEAPAALGGGAETATARGRLWTPSQFPTIPSLSPHRRAMVALSPACQGSAGKVDFQVGQAGPPRFGSRLRRSDRDDSFVSERPKPKGTRNRSAARSSPRLHSPHRGSPPARPRRASCSGTLAGAGPRGADGEWCTRSAKLDAKQRARRCVTPVLIAP